MTDNKVNPTGKRPKKPKKQWTVLYVSDTGNVQVKDNWWHTIAIAGGLFFICAVLAFGISALRARAKTQAHGLKSEIARLEKKLALVRSEKNRHLVRTVRQDQRRQGRFTDNGPDAPAPARDTGRQGVEGHEPSAVFSQPGPPDAQNPRAALPVLMEDFSLRPLENGGFRIRFKVVNNLPGSKSMSGYVFVVLKNEDPDQKGWMCFPKADLNQGRPADPEKGFSFSISNYKYIRARSDVPLKKELSFAAVMVFDKEGKFVAERTFPLQQEEDGH